MEIVIIVAVIGYLLLHARHARRSYRKYHARGHRGWSLYWRSGMGPWLSIPLPGGFRIGHRL